MLVAALLILALVAPFRGLADFDVGRFNGPGLATCGDQKPVVVVWARVLELRQGWYYRLAYVPAGDVEWYYFLSLMNQDGIAQWMWFGTMNANTRVFTEIGQFSREAGLKAFVSPCEWLYP